MSLTHTLLTTAGICLTILALGQAGSITAFGTGMTSQPQDGGHLSDNQDGGHLSDNQDGAHSSSPPINMGPDVKTTRAQSDEVVTNKFMITDEILPSITSPAAPITKIIMNYNRYEVIQCEAVGKPTPRFVWYRDGVEVGRNEAQLQAFPNGTLVLKKFKSFNNGYYQCRATNRLGTSVSDIVHIIAEVPPSGSDSEWNVTPVPEKEPYSIQCDDLSPTVPELWKRWYFGIDRNELRIDDRRGVDTDGTLHFAHTKLGVDDSLYTCGLVPDQGTSSTITLFQKGEVSVIRNTASSLAKAKPKRMFSKDNLKAIIGESITLECFFASMPPAKITWKNSSHHLIEPKNPRLVVEDYGRKLVITKVKQEDEGTFSCIGENTFGSTEITINVNVTSRPMVVSALASETVPDNSDITLKCQTKAAFSERLAPVRWYRNGRTLTNSNLPDPARYSFNSDLSELRITSLDKQLDTACFQCNSSNSEGYEFFDASIRVINSIVITKQPADEMVIKHGDSVDITIQATGDVCCDNYLLWSFNGTNIIHLNQWLPFQQDPNSDALIFNSSLLSEGQIDSYVGVYTCHVSNQHQSVDVKFAILLEGGRTEPVEASGASMGLWWIGLVCGIAAILIVIIIIVIIYKSNYPASTYKLEQQEIKHHLNPEEDLLNQSFHEI